jgi:luciferase family oxidoreductase group 1
VPLWILGSSLYGAQLAAALGPALRVRVALRARGRWTGARSIAASFKPSAQLAKPHAMVGVNVVAAATDAEARRLFTSHQQAFANLRRGRPGPQQPPIDDIDAYWSPAEKEMASRMLACSIVGSRETVRHELERFVAWTQADELMVVSAIYDAQARRRSYEILAEVAGVEPR